MAAAIVDLNISAGETFNMEIQFWENSDRTIPIDISTFSFRGAFNFTDKCIDMTITQQDNSILCTVQANVLTDLPKQGSYIIDVTTNSGTYKVQQGRVFVDRNELCS